MRANLSVICNFYYWVTPHLLMVHSVFLYVAIFGLLVFRLRKLVVFFFSYDAIVWFWYQCILPKNWEMILFHFGGRVSDAFESILL